MASQNNYPAIVVAAFNRVSSLQRLLDNLEHAHYPVPVTLVISIDKSDSTEVKKTADAFQWKHGNKRIIAHEKHLGLKEHILSCGDLTSEYDSIIMLEDDLFTSPYFYQYALEALTHYRSEIQVAGISLYSYDISENGFNPFIPLDDGNDVYFMQVASSWGQAWTKEQWSAFRRWFKENQEMEATEQLPPYLLNWHENSWKKHFIRYLHHTGKFFVFPRQSFTTNFEERGATATTKGLYQVAVAEAPREYKMTALNESKSVYDASFEMQASCLKKWCPALKNFDFTTDLFGTLPVANCKTPYLLTTKSAKDPTFSFALEMFPPVLNVINDLIGEQIKLVKKENVLSENVDADMGYYKYKPVSEIIFQEELVARVEKVYSNYSEKIDALNKAHNESLEAVHSEMRGLHKDYNQRIDKLHEDYAVQIKSSVETALADFQFKIDYPLFAVNTIVNEKNFELALATAKSVQQQDYLGVSHKIIVIGKNEGLHFPDDMKAEVISVDSLEQAVEIAQHHFNFEESIYHCWLEPGSILLPKAFSTVRDIFKRFIEVNWLKGLPVGNHIERSRNRGEWPPHHSSALSAAAANGIDLRWDKIKFQKASLDEIGNKISSGVFWKKHVWQKAGATLNTNFPHRPDIELYNRMFSIEHLFVVMSYLSASNGYYVPSQLALEEFRKLKVFFLRADFSQILLSSLGAPFFKRDIPVLRALYKSQHSFSPLIRFDTTSQSFYLSDY